MRIGLLVIFLGGLRRSSTSLHGQRQTRNVANLGLAKVVEGMQEPGERELSY